MKPLVLAIFVTATLPAICSCSTKATVVLRIDDRLAGFVNNLTRVDLRLRHVSDQTRSRRLRDARTKRGRQGRGHYHCIVDQDVEFFVISE